MNEIVNLIREEIRKYEGLKKAHSKSGYHLEAWTCERNIELLTDLLADAACLQSEDGQEKQNPYAPLHAACLKMKNAIETRFLAHSAVCNFPTNKGSFCNCGINDMLYALKALESMKQNEENRNNDGKTYYALP